MKIRNEMIQENAMDVALLPFNTTRMTKSIL